MEALTCRVLGCDEPVSVKKRRLCRRHYAHAWRSGTLDNVNIWRHTVTSFDAAAMTGECSECGSGVAVFERNGRMNCSRSAKKMKVKWRHGLDQDALDGLLEVLGHRCQVCRDPFSDDNPYCVDHDHACCPGDRSCGACVRGLLCRRCNVGIGMLRDDAAIALAAHEYLRSAEKLPLEIVGQPQKLPFELQA